MPQMLRMLRSFGENPREDRILFGEGASTDLPSPAGTFRRAAPSDDRTLFPAVAETIADWVIDRDGLIVAEGGVLFHYNPPYGDVFMEVAEQERRKGYGSYLVQELKRVCAESGKVPAARCRPDNVASIRSLQKAGFEPCGKILVATVRIAT
jgi:GNAT superfamily N-acetyltransferase